MNLIGIKTMAFYALYDGVPKDPKEANDDGNNIFNSFDEASVKMKQIKNSRVKSFYTYDEALQFVRYGLERSLAEPSPAVQTPEKSLHSGPKSQDLVLFRKNIEQGHIEKVIDTIWKNPRYLIGAGDTPTILKESSRYNAMHVAALSKNGKMCDAILQAVANPDFVECLHGRSTEVCKDISVILLDLYLNMPEKGRNETPLHLASKFGALDVVEVLTSYPQCIDSPNKDGLRAKDIICSRGNVELSHKIEAMMRERFYVPVIRSVDNSMPPIIGEPFSTSNPPNLCFDPLSPEMEIQAYAGPMNKEQAHGFRRRWKTPPRISSRTSPGSPQVRSPLQLPRFEPNTSSSTPKTVERRGAGVRQLFTKTSAQQLFPSPNDDVIENDLEAAVINLKLNSDSSPPTGVIEKTLPLTDSTNINPTRTKLFALPVTTPFKLYRDLHSRLKDNVNDSLNSSTNSDNSTMFDSPMYKERHTKLSDTEKGLELVGRELAKEQNIKWREHWTFLDEFIDISSSDGLHKLEHHFKKRADKTDDLSHSPINNLCANLERFHVKDKRALVLASTPKVSVPVSLPNVGTPSSAYLCAEKSWQVYAKRMAKPIVVHLDSVAQINDTLKAELKRLQSLICSYKEDLRFWSVDFQAAHSRFAHLIVYYVSQERDCDISVIKEKITQIQQTTQKHVINGDLKAEFISANLQLQCLLNCMLKYLSDPASTMCPDVLTTEEDSADIWKSEHKCNCAWLLEKQDSRIKRLTRRYKDRVEAAAASETIASDALNDWHSSIISASSSDDDEFLSDSGSDNDEFFTPPESPSQCGTPKRKDYKLYVLGDGPTKTDVDVLNALTDIEIDRATFPYVFNWKAAMLEHPIEERKNFPVPTTVNPTKYRSAESRAKLLEGLPIKCVISTQHRLPRSPVKKMSNMLRPTVFQMNRLKVHTKPETVPAASEDVLVAKSPLFYCPVIKTDHAAQTNGSTISDVKVSDILSPSKILEDDVKPVSVTVISSGQNLVLRTDQSLDAELVSNVFINSKDPPDELNTVAQDVHAV